MRYLFNEDELVAGFVMHMMPESLRDEHGFGPCRAIGVINRDNELIAGLVYSRMKPKSGLIDLTIAALPGHVWLTPETLRVMYRYPFIDCGCQMLTTVTLASNQSVISQLARMNWELIAFPRLFGRNVDAVIGRLTDDAWVASKYCQRYRHHEHERPTDVVSATTVLPAGNGAWLSAGDGAGLQSATGPDHGGIDEHSQPASWQHAARLIARNAFSQLEQSDWGSGRVVDIGWG